ncbi:Transglycosylase SLT domain-containing protein [Rhodococcoides kyotonense]|uniref:Transglycosylase SLT domain-containing protein n=1 Tax=Rhodococcoides kyotonense TaxID=398843 RepID=A0A239I570_9NOCA|nr:Transglycosylase SLT domain-containing protein [Rhodococcus kyotonensis]
MCAIVVGGIAGAAASASMSVVEPPVPVVAPAPLPPSETVPGLAAPAPRPEQSLSAPEPEEPEPPPEQPRTVAVRAPTLDAIGIPDAIAAAYRDTEAAMASESPSCHLPWQLLAGIGQVESGHAHNGQIDDDGTTVTRILGPVLDGRRAGHSVILDTDRGTLDGDTEHDRAVGPMQFIPSTWARYASDGNDDEISDPNNIHDATLAAGRYLCSGGLDLSDPADETAALLRYNNSPVYVTDVLAWSQAYRLGGDSVTGVPTDVVAPVVDEVPTPTPETRAAPPPDTPTPPPMAILVLPPLPPLPCVIFCPPPVR